MPSYLQKHRPLQVTTPIGEETLLVTAFRGTEQLSRLFSFELDLVAANSTVIDFSKLVGNDITLRIATPTKGDAIEWRCISGICARFSQGNRNEEFTAYYAEVVPKAWLLTHRAQSRIFQQKSVPDILKEVWQGFACDFQLRGQYDPREYCVQYRETDFDFASRLKGASSPGPHPAEPLPSMITTNRATVVKSSMRWVTPTSCRSTTSIK